jgi:hypothetical protein
VACLLVPRAKAFFLFSSFCLVASTAFSCKKSHIEDTSRDHAIDAIDGSRNLPVRTDTSEFFCTTKYGYVHCTGNVCSCAVRTMFRSQYIINCFIFVSYLYTV